MEDPISFYNYTISNFCVDLDRKLILDLVNSFLGLSTVKYHSKSEFINANPNLWTEDSALIKLSNVMVALGGKYYSFYLQYFAEKWTYKTEFKSDMINKMEHFFTFAKGLSSITRYLAIKALSEYQIGRGFKTRNTAVNDLEFDLIRAIQVAVSNELGKYIGVSRLSTIFKGWDGYFRRVLHSSERNNFGTRFLDQITQKIGGPISSSFMKKSVIFQLKGENLKIIEDAIKVYREVRLKDIKYKYIIPDGAPNEQALQIIELLRKAYSKHPMINPSNKFISYSRLFKDIMRKPTPFEHVLENKHPFTENMIDHIASQITKDLLEIYAPEEFAELNGELITYPSYTRSYESEPEEVFRHYMNYLFNSSFDKRKHLWLRGIAGRPLELDGCNRALRIAFECDGPQHYDFKFIMRAYKLAETEAKAKLQRQMTNDYLKDKGCKRNGFVLIRFRPQKLHFKNYQQYIIDQYKILTGKDVYVEKILNYKEVIKTIRSRKN